MRNQLRLIVFSIGVKLADKNVKENYLAYWQQRLEESKQQGVSLDETQKYSNILENIWEFFTFITEYKYEYIEKEKLINEHLIMNMIQKVKQSIYKDKI